MKKIAIVSDIHANYYCFEKVLEDIKKLNINTIVFLGDYITDGFENNEVLNILKNYEYVIAGNREISIAHYDGKSWDESSQFKNMLYTYNDLNKDNMKYIKSLPIYKIFSIYKKTICICHGSPFKANEIVYHDSFDIFDKLIKNYPADIYFFGHMHQAYLTNYMSKFFINPGSVTLPADFPTIKYGIFDFETMSYEQKNICYDFNILKNYYTSNSHFKENREWYNILIHTNNTGIDYICAFINFISKKANEKHIDIQSRIPNELWHSSFLDFMKENNLAIF